MQTIDNFFTFCYTKVEQNLVYSISYFDSTVHKIKIRLLNGKFTLNNSKSKAKTSTSFL